MGPLDPQQGPSTALLAWSLSLQEVWWQQESLLDIQGNSRTRLRKLTAMAIRIPLITNLPTTVISSRNNLYGLGAADQFPVFQQRRTSVSSSSLADYLSISLVVIARGVALTATILTYSSVTPLRGEDGILVKGLRQSAMFWPEVT